MAQVRQLAAIMFADIVGYTALMEEDESLALRLRHKLQQKLETDWTPTFYVTPNLLGRGLTRTFVHHA